MSRLSAFVALIGSGIVAFAGVAHAGGGAIRVPEPSSIALLGVSAAAFALWRRGRRK
jgi:hypothetical protein